MTITPLNLGAVANDGNGQSLRSGGQVINANFAELDLRTAAAQEKADAAIPSGQKGVASGVATLGEDGKLPVSQLPPLAVNEVFTVASQAAMLALTAERGDAAIRTDQNGQWYVLTTDVPTVLANWRPINQNLGVALTALGALTPAADTIAYFSGPATAATTAFTAKARALLARTDTAGMQAELALVPVTSTTDTTAGRLVTPGWMGIGGTSVAFPVSTLNNGTVANGQYFIDNSYAGAPYNGFWGVSVQKVYDTYSLQTVWDLNTPGQTYQRTINNGSPAAWAKTYTGDNAVSDPQTTGGLMSSTTVNGFSIFKYANGQLCITGSIPTSPTIAANSNGSFDVTIPSGLIGAYIASSYCSVAPSSSNDVGGTNSYLASLTSVRVYIRNGATAQTFSGAITVWGRWK
ncbi:hypothetical protein [Pseudomonas azotoformans]